MLSMLYLRIRLSWILNNFVTVMHLLELFSQIRVSLDTTMVKTFEKSSSSQRSTIRVNLK